MKQTIILLFLLLIVYNANAQNKPLTEIKRGEIHNEKLHGQVEKIVETQQKISSQKKEPIITYNFDTNKNIIAVFIADSLGKLQKSIECTYNTKNLKTTEIRTDITKPEQDGNMGTYENNKANELTRAFVKNPLITFVARHWVNTVETPKIKNGIQYQPGYSGLNMKFGRNLYFEIDGSFTDNHNARCGLDGNIHRYIGKWKLAENNTIEIYDLVEEHNKAHSYSIYPDHNDMIVLPKGKFKILKIDNQIMNLQIIKNYEQKAKYKVKKARTDK
jgi:hypothetical protein